jgi:hypothetical protein
MPGQLAISARAAQAFLDGPINLINVLWELKPPQPGA